MSDSLEPEKDSTWLNPKPVCSMTSSEFFTEYIFLYRIKSYRCLRVRNSTLHNTKLIIYILRREYRLTFKEISEMVLMSYQLANIYYYDVLRDEASRNEAEARFKEITSARNIPQS